ncbi:MAG: glutamine--fructose-6-phosphate transaminase (isomerizing) [bacterium]|nr:glutamine--fructose-6-phosphate transaminase (isomerizing) [bacterium]
MCGIFGYVGKEGKTASLILDGLKRLEYRGYDSWGIAIKVQSSSARWRMKVPASAETLLGKQSSKKKSRFIVEKHVGKIGGATLDFRLIIHNSSLGIGHTRWATHGGVTVANAHPHLDCSQTIAVVHNGIVENYEELKKKLKKRGHKFLSETDTEVIPHLIEENLKSGKGFSTSVRDAFNELAGLNAIVVANTVSREIVAAKTGSPLVIGAANGNLFICSDVPALIPYTNKVMFLADREMAILGGDVKVIKLPEGRPVKKSFQKVDWKFENAELGKFPHFMLKEIFEQPKVLRGIVENSTQIGELAKIVDQAFGTYLVGCGSASYACLAGQYLFSNIAKKHANFAVGSEFGYLEDFLTPKSLVIALSQSGETIDVIESVEKAKKKKAKIFAIVNNLGSTLYRVADHKILLGAGPEKAVAATKSVTAKQAILLILAFTLAKKSRQGRELLKGAIKESEKILEEKNISKIKKVAGQLAKKDHIYIIGRGISHALALEATLKVKECSYIHAEGFAAGELKHGVIALIEKGTPCIVFAPNDETYNDTISGATEIKSRGGMIIGISHKDSDLFDYFLPVGDCDVASIIPNTVVAQLLAYYMAVEKGLDPDKPRNLAKSVTVK